MFESLAALSGGALVFLVLGLLIALGFEFVNGFHDTANAVATVIYTNTLRPWRAVILSGLCNFLGVFMGGIGVAVSIIYLLPAELLIAGGTGAGLAMVLSLLLGAIAWNLGTWYLGLPASSSHTMIGAILGVGLANSLRVHGTLDHGVNWGKAGGVGLSLLVSPLFGFSVAALLLLAMRRFVSDRRLFEPPSDAAPPPGWIRALLVSTCAGVSFAHGSNDGQKGVGLIMLILIGIVPAGFALDLAAPPDRIEEAVAALRETERLLTPVAVATTAPGATPEGAARGEVAGPSAGTRARATAARVRAMLEGRTSLKDVPREQRFAVRAGLVELREQLEEGAASGEIKPPVRGELQARVERTRVIVDYAPTWVLVAVALALGTGTMIGWKRIVVTVGEKIGKTHLTYGQGAAAELVAASTIGVAALAGLPVSTTHVLSSGVAGTMIANGSTLQATTVRNIALAWVLTLPAAILLSGGLFLLLSALLGGVAQ